MLPAIQDKIYNTPNRGPLGYGPYDMAHIISFTLEIK